MKYPNYPWNLDRRRKLSKEQVYDIKHSSNMTQKELGSFFCVSQARVWQILHLEEYKQRKQLYYQQHKDLYRKYTKEQRRQVRARKRRLQLLGVRDYYKQKTRVYRKRLCRALETAQRRW